MTIYHHTNDPLMVNPNVGKVCSVCGGTIRARQKSERYNHSGAVLIRHVPTCDVRTVLTEGTRVRLVSEFTYRGTPDRGLGVDIGDEGVIRRVVSGADEAYYVRWERRANTFYVDGSCLEVVQPAMPVGTRVRLASQMTVHGEWRDYEDVGAEGVVSRNEHPPGTRHRALIRVQWDNHFNRANYVDASCLEVIEPVAERIPVGTRVRVSRLLTVHGVNSGTLANVGEEGEVEQNELTGRHADLIRVQFDHGNVYYVDAPCLEVIEPEVTEPAGIEIGTRVRLARPMTVHGTPDTLVSVGEVGRVTSFSESRTVARVEWDTSRRFYVDTSCLEAIEEAPLANWERELLEPPPPSQRCRHCDRRITPHVGTNWADSIGWFTCDQLGEHNGGQRHEPHPAVSQPRDSRGRFASPSNGDDWLNSLTDPFDDLL